MLSNYRARSIPRLQWTNISGAETPLLVLPAIWIQVVGPAIYPALKRYSGATIKTSSEAE